MSLNDRLRIVVNEFFHGNKAAFARAAKIWTKELIVVCLFGVIQNLRLEFWEFS